MTVMAGKFPLNIEQWREPARAQLANLYSPRFTQELFAASLAWSRKDSPGGRLAFNEVV